MVQDGVRGFNQAAVRGENAWRVLSVVRARGVASRAEAARATGLTLTTVHRLVGDLERRRLVAPVQTLRRTATGRPPRLFRFNAAIAHVVGIDVGNETTRAALATLDGSIIARLSASTDHIADDLSRGVAGLVRRLRAAPRPPGLLLVSVGVGVPAVTDPLTGRLVRASLHRAWDGLPLGAELRRRLRTRVVVGQDDHFAALAELRRGACRGLDSGLVLNVGKGIGAGLIAGGAVYAGARAAAGRLGWVELPDVAGDLSPAAALLTADGLIANYRDEGGKQSVRNARDVFEADAEGDAAAAVAVDRFADQLGWLVAASVNVFDPARVVVGGGIGGSFERLAPAIRRRIDGVGTSPPSVVPSPLGPDAGIVGAVVAATDLAVGWLRESVSESLAKEEATSS